MVAGILVLTSAASMGVNLLSARLMAPSNYGTVAYWRMFSHLLLPILLFPVAIPILIAAFAAFGFAWLEFPGRNIVFTIIVALLVVPLQIALVPILRDYVSLNLNGTFLGVWLAHTGFGLALATYLLFGYISTLPREILESAFIDGASHFTIFVKLVE